MSGYDLSGVVPDLPCDGGDCPECPPENLESLTNNLNLAHVGVPYSQECFAVGGTPPYTWNQFGMNWPAGLAQDPSTGTISGTPTTVTPTRALVLHVTDTLFQTAWSNVTITVDA